MKDVVSGLFMRSVLTPKVSLRSEWNDKVWNYGSCRRWPIGTKCPTAQPLDLIGRSSPTVLEFKHWSQSWYTRLSRSQFLTFSHIEPPHPPVIRSSCFSVATHPMLVEFATAERIRL